MSAPAEPRMSVVLVVRDTSQALARVLGAIRRQTIGTEIECVLVTGDAEELRSAIREPELIESVQVVEMGSVDTEGAAKAAGVRAAQSPLVGFLEDHTFPDPRWAEALVSRHAQGEYAVVGPVIGNANPRTAASWACYLVYYGWAGAARPESELTILPSNHSCYRRDVLLGYGDELENMLEVETVLHGDLRRRGLRLYQEPAAQAFHLNYARVSAAAHEYFIGSRIFAAERAAGWGLLKRAVFAGGSLLLPLIRTLRLLGDAQRAALGRATTSRALLPAFVILTAGAAGEMLGYALGDGGARERLMEFIADRDKTFGAGELEDIGGLAGKGH